jgi:hypothetical protein
MFLARDRPPEPKPTTGKEVMLVKLTTIGKPYPATSIKKGG